MKHRCLVLRAALFAVSCYFLLWFCAWAVHFRLPREIFAITLALICLAAEMFASYLMLRQLWRWSGAVTERFFKDKAATKAESLLVEHR